jgi:hypothetical protein
VNIFSLLDINERFDCPVHVDPLNYETECNVSPLCGWLNWTRRLTDKSVVKSNFLPEGRQGLDRIMSIKSTTFLTS